MTPEAGFLAAEWLDARRRDAPGGASPSLALPQGGGDWFESFITGTAHITGTAQSLPPWGKVRMGDAAAPRHGPPAGRHTR